MDYECLHTMTERKKAQWETFLHRCGIDSDPGVERTILLWDDGELIAAGSRQHNVLKCIAVDPARQGEGLTGTLMTHLRQDAFDAGFRHLFLYTKPQNQTMFSSLFFYPIAKTADVLLMESSRNGIDRFIDSLEKPRREGTVGSIVMNCNPFTRGHRHLIETAAAQCDWLYVFVLSEDRSFFPAADRMELVRQGTKDLPNVTVNPTGQYLISSATFPTYFLKDKAPAADIHCLLDIAVFTRYFVPAFSITRRYVGTEPFCGVTSRYNEALRTHLPAAGVEFCELPRLEQDATAISASGVRSLLHKNQPDALRRLVPDTTFTYLEQHNLI